MNASPPEFRVALVNPPYFPRYSRSQRSPGVIKSGTMYYPYWLAHAAALLEQHGFGIHLYDCPAANVTLEQLIEQLATYRPDLLVIETSTASYRNDLRVAAALKQRFPTAKICLTGTHATANWQEALQAEPAVDYVAIGEYDFIVLDLAKCLAERDADGVAKVAAIGYRDASGAPARGPIRPLMSDVNTLPWIAPIYKRFLDPKNYYFSLASYPMVMLIGGRGCVAKCVYCVYPQVMHGHSYRTRSPESIVGEMKWIQTHMPEVKEIVFEDDTFTGDRAFAKRVSELVEEMGVSLPWFANVRTGTDKDTLQYMKKSGFRCCAAGFESGDNIILKNMWKGQSVETQKRFVKACKEVGVLVHGCFMVGFPGETQETMQKTLDLAIDLSPDSAQFYPVMPFPGTSYYKWAKEKGYLATDNFEEWLNDEGGHRCVLNLPGLPAEAIEKFCERAYLRFHFRPKYIWYKLKQSILHPIEGARSVKAFLYFLVYLATNKRKETQPFRVDPPEVPANWYGLHKLPKGRMNEQADRVATANASTDPAGSLAALAREQPQL